MRALFSSWCDEYYNLRILLIGENLHKIYVQSDNRASAKPPQKYSEMHCINFEVLESDKTINI